MPIGINLAVFRVVKVVPTFTCKSLSLHTEKTFCVLSIAFTLVKLNSCKLDPRWGPVTLLGPINLEAPKASDFARNGES